MIPAPKLELTVQFGTGSGDGTGAALDELRRWIQVCDPEHRPLLLDMEQSVESFRRRWML